MALEGCNNVWTYSMVGWLVLLAGRSECARPRFDASTDMGLVLVPADAEVESVIYRLRATDQDADFPLVFDITASVTPVVRIENLPCTLYNKICQANVILTRRLTPGRLHDFNVRVRDSNGDTNNMQATISVTNATTQRNKIFPHIPAIIMVPEDTKPGKELDYILVRSNQWSGKPVYIEMWQPKELFTIRQRQTPAETRGVITLIGELDFETQSMYTLTIYATDPYTEPKKDTRNIAGLQLVVIVQDVQDVPPIFILAPPLTKINNTVQPGDVILRVHAEDGDKGVPREVTYGLVSEGNPFTTFFNISEKTGEIVLARPLEELTQITHVGAPVVLSVVAEEIRRSTTEPPAQATVVELGLLLGEPGNSPPFFDNDNYVAWMDENAEPGSPVTFTEHYSTKVRDEDIGKAGVFALKLHNNNGTFEISPTVAERTANFVITVRDNNLIDYEIHKSLRFMIIAQEVGPATNLSATVPATIFLRDVNDNAPEFVEPSYEVTLSENVTAGTRVVQVHATDKDTGSFGRIQYTRILGLGSEAFVIDPNTGIITVAMRTSILDRETTSSLRLSVEARDEDGKGLRGTVPLTINLLDVNDNPPIFEKSTYQFTLNVNMTNFTMPAFIKATDADAEQPNNEIRYEIIHGNYDEKFHINELTGEIFLREPVNKVRRTRHNPYQNFATKLRKGLAKVQRTFRNMTSGVVTVATVTTELPIDVNDDKNTTNNGMTDKNGLPRIRKKREDDDVMFTLTARAYDLGVPHMSGTTQVIVMRIPATGARTVMFVVPGENPDPVKTAETLATITGGRISVQEIRPYTIKDVPTGSSNVPSPEGRKKSIVVARFEPIVGETSLVDIEKIRTALAANGVGVIGGDMPTGNMKIDDDPKSNNEGRNNHNGGTNTNTSNTITTVNNEQVTIYKAENRLLFWLLIILGLLMLIALIAVIICCICPGCPFYMAPRKRRVHSSETLITRSDARPKRHLHRKHGRFLEGTWHEKKQAWSADPTRRNWHFNRRNRRAPGLASLPGDVRTIDREQEIIEKTGSLRLRDVAVPMYMTEPIRRPDDERIYMEDVDGHGTQGYGIVDVEYLRQQDADRNADLLRRIYVTDGDKRANEQSKLIREQHFYRDGNTEVLRLVTRGQMDEAMIVHPMRRPQTLVIDHGHQSGAYRIDGKEILLQRFIEDQGMRQEGQGVHDSLQDIERSAVETHQRQRETMNFQQQQLHQQQQQQLQSQQQKILLIPERLEKDHRQHYEELGPDVQRLIIDHGNFVKTDKFDDKETPEINATLLVHAPMTKASEEIKQESNEPKNTQNSNIQHYSTHDVELARQNALLTRLLMERDGREAANGILIDSGSYLETQSLPGQVAIATQTDRTTATQTELPNRSRSDNDESEEEARMRKKLRSKKRHGEGEPRRVRTIWMKSPVGKEVAKYNVEKRGNVVRKKMKDIKDVRRVSLEPQVLQEISDSLDENGDPRITERGRDDKDDLFSGEESRNGDKSERRLEECSSFDVASRDGRRFVQTRRETRNIGEDVEDRRSQRIHREDILVPSLRLLEKEMTSLSKKLSKFSGKKIFQSSNGSETDTQDKTVKIVTKMDSKVVETEEVGKMAEEMKTKSSKSFERLRSSESMSTDERSRIRDKNVVEKTTRLVSSEKSKNLGSGSSDLDDNLGKPEKRHLQVSQLELQEQLAETTSHGRLQRQSQVEDKDKGRTKGPPLTRLRQAVEEDVSFDNTSKISMPLERSKNDSMVMEKCVDGNDKEQTKLGHSSNSSSDEPKDVKVTSDKGLTVDVSQMMTTKTDEGSAETPRQEISILSPVETVKDVSVRKTVMEIKRISPELPEVTMNILPETAMKEETIRLHISEDTKVVDESSASAVSQLEFKKSVEQVKLVETIKENVIVVSKESANELISRVTIESGQTSQARDSFATEDAEMTKNVVVESMTMEDEDEKRDEAMQKKVPDNAEAIDSTCIDVTQTESLESGKSDDKENVVEVPVEHPSQDIELGDTKSHVEQEDQISEFVELKDEGKPSALQKEEVSVITQESDNKIIETVLVEKVLETVNSDDEKSSDDSQIEKMAEPTNPNDEKMFNTAKQKEKVDESMKLDESEHLEESKDSLQDQATDVDQEGEIRNIVAQQCDDPGMFTDNFDSFCGTLAHPRDYSDKLDSNGEFSYETLQSESSEEQITIEEVTDVKVVAEKDDVVDNGDKSIEPSLPLELKMKEDNEQPPAMSSTEKPTPSPSKDEPSDDLAKMAASRKTSPVSSKSSESPERKANEIDDGKTEIKTETAIVIPTSESDTNTKITIQNQPDDIPGHAEESLAASEVEQIIVDQTKIHVVNVPIVPPLDIRMANESTIESHSEQSDFKPDPHISTSSPLSSPAASMLDTNIQKEFGIADSLFIDAKLLKSPSGSARKVDTFTASETQQRENSMNEEKKIITESSPVDLVELSSVLFDDDDDDSDDSEASSKTMLTARPYGTPRHRPISGSETVKDTKAMEHESIDEPVEVTLETTQEQVTKEMLSSLDDKTDESVERSSTIDSRLLSEKVGQSLGEKSPDASMDPGKMIPVEVVDNPVAPVDPVTSDSELNENKRAHVETHTDEEPVTSIRSGEADVDGEETSGRRGNATSDGTLEKVQELNQIRREKLSADADGFDSLPETVERVMNIDDAKLSKETIASTRKIDKTEDGASVVVPSTIGPKKPVTSAGKDAKSIVRKRESSKEGVNKVMKKIIASTSKSLSPSREKKLAKDEKHSLTVEQSGRVRDYKRVARRGASQVEEPTDTRSRTSGIRRTLSNTERVGKNVKHDEKLKVERLKKSSLNNEVEKLKSTRSSETRGTQARIKDHSGMTKISEKSKKLGIGKKNVGDRAKQKTLEVEKAERDEHQDEIEKFEDSRVKEVREEIDILKADDVKLSSKTERDKSKMTLSLSEKGNKEDYEGSVESKSLQKSKSLPDRMTRDPATSVSSVVNEKIPERIVEITEDRKTALTDKTTCDLVNSAIKDAKEIIPQGVVEKTEGQLTVSKNETPMDEESTKTTMEETTNMEDSAIKKVTEDSSMVEETKFLTKDAATTSSETPGTEDSPVTVQPSNATEVDTTTLNVAESLEQIIQLAEQIMEEPVEAQNSNVRSKTNDDIATPFKEEVGSEVSEEPTPSTRMEDQSDDTKSPEKSSDLVQADPNENEKSEVTAGEIQQDNSKVVATAIDKATTSPRKSTKHRRETDATTIHEGQSRYMEWYKLKREEMERKRQERKDGDDDDEKPKWLRRTTRQRWFKGGPGEKKMFDPKIGDGRSKRIKPRVNAESEQLKAIVRQGRALRKAQGQKIDEPQIQIFAPEKPEVPLSSVESRCHHHHHLVQHSEYNYEKMPIAPFYLHPPIVPTHSSSSPMSSQSYDDCRGQPTDNRCTNEVRDSGIVVQIPQAGNKLRHQQILEKKSVFDIAYDEAAPSQLRADSTTPPS